jgi:excisionase family DNA binding protein
VKPEGSRWIDVEEASEYLDVSQDTVYKLVSAGLIAHARVGRKIRTTRQAIDRYLEAQMASMEQQLTGK